MGDTMMTHTCGACRWRERARCVLLRHRRVESASGRTCPLWDPVEGEKVPPEPWRRGCSAIAFAAEGGQGGGLGSLRDEFRAAMLDAGIPTGTREG